MGMGGSGGGGYTYGKRINSISKRMSSSLWNPGRYVICWYVEVSKFTWVFLALAANFGYLFRYHSARACGSPACVTTLRDAQ
jgi:hypothetical protein